MNFNIKTWEFPNYAAFFVSIIMISSFYVALPFGYVFASTFGELIRKVNR
jgi:hypothetical protein